jgi:hypothetical protein
MDDKWGRRLFTAGAAFLVLLGLAHGLSLLGKPPAHNETERQLLDLASSYKFNVMGSMRTYDNFMRGFSISFMLACLVLGTLGLTLRRERAGLLKNIAFITVAWLIAMTAVSLRYFFVFPTSCLVIALVIFALSWINLPGEARVG